MIPESRLGNSADRGLEARHAGHLRRLNLERILTVAMDQQGSFTRAELIQATALSAPTVGSLVSHLIKRALLRDLGTGPSRGGRRPSFMEFNARYGFVAAIDVGPTRTRLVVANLRGEPLARRVMSTPAAMWPAAMLGRIANTMRGLLKEAQVPVDKLLAVAAGAPGAVDHDRGGLVTLAPNLKGWSQVPMGEILKRALGVPVIVENDVNLAILGERWRGAARGHDTCAFMTVGTGIGAGVVINGELHRGHHFLAGEIGLMCMGPQYIDRDFGSRGCLESLAGLKALAPRHRSAQADRWVPALFEAAQGGDPKARKAIGEVAALIGIAAANLSLVIDPSLLVLGGALIAHGEPLLSEVRRVVARIVPAPIQIAVSVLGKEAPMWGALMVATNEARRQLRQELRDSPSRS